jgi:tetratricopeptide (TPR) repeat protein
VVARGLQYLDALSREAGGDTALQVEVGEAYARIGDVQGNSGLSNLGDSQGALDSYAKARAVLERALARDPRHLGARKTLARVRYSAAGVYDFLRRVPDAHASALAALAIWERLSRDAPSDEDAVKGMATTNLMIGNIMDLERQGDGLPRKIQALGMFERLLAAGYTGERARNVALAHKYIAGNLLMPLNGSIAGSRDEALDHLRAARDLDGKRVTDDPRDALAKLDLSFDLSQMGTAFFGAGDLSSASDTFQQVVDVRRDLAAADARDTRARERLMFGLLSLAETKLAMNRADEAERAAGEAIAVGVPLVEAHPDDHVARGYLAAAHARIADAEARTDRRRACGSYRVAVSQFRELERRTVLDPQERETLEHVSREVDACAPLRSQPGAR